MKEIVKVDLKIARQQSGLRSEDVAALLGVSRARISKLENGIARPQVRELISLAVIYGKSLDDLFQLTASRLTEKIAERLGHLEAINDGSGRNELRTATLGRLYADLSNLNHDGYGG